MSRRYEQPFHKRENMKWPIMYKYTQFQRHMKMKTTMRYTFDPTDREKCQS